MSWRIVEKAKVVQDTNDPCTTGIMINGKVYPLGQGGSGGSSGSGSSGGAELPKSDDEEIEMLIMADLLPAVTTQSGAVLSDNSGNVILRY